MGSNTWRAEQWPGLVERIRSGDPTVGADLTYRERLFDNFFQIIDKTTYSPVLSQSSTVVTYSTSSPYTVEGMRIGNWVMLNLCLPVTGAGVGSFIRVTVPPQFPIGNSGNINRSLGIITVKDISAAEYAVGVCTPFNSTTLTGFADEDSTLDVFPKAALAANDLVSLSVQYYTDIAL